MIKTIAHLSDIHIRKSPLRNIEYMEVFNELLKSLEEKKPDRIVIVGDLVHDYLDLQGEQLILAHKFLNSLAAIAPLRITRGNHDMKKSNLKRVDTIRAIIEVLDNSNVIYYNETGFFTDENIVWCVWHHGEKKNNPWKTKDGKNLIWEDNKTYIDLFHDPINGCKDDNGFEMMSKSFYGINDFVGDLSFFGDIHLKHYLNEEKTKAYCGSLIAQKFNEGDDKFHGYLLWDISNKTANEISIHNNYSFKNIDINQYTDFEDLDFEIDDPTSIMKVRFIWKTLPQTRTKVNERLLKSYFNEKYDNITISNKNDFIENESIQIKDDNTLSNITSVSVQHNIFTEYLEKIGTDKNVISDVLEIDDEIQKNINIDDDFGVEWNIIKIGGENFISYSKFDIDWRDLDGLFQIMGVNTGGKTTIFKAISYALYGKTLETESRKKFGDVRYVNNRNGATSCNVYLIFEANGEYYGIKRETRITKSKNGDITGAPTTLNYYLLNSPDDELNSNSNIENLNDDRPKKTQKLIDAIIGSYENFKRIIMTTSDTLNKILSNDKAEFIDSMLNDSGADIFDKKLEAFKLYQKKINLKPRVTCNIELTNEKNKTLNNEINSLQDQIKEIETVKLPEIKDRIKKGRNYIEELIKKLHKIDDEIYNLDINELQQSIADHRNNITEIKLSRVKLVENISNLIDSYDEKKLNELIEKKNEHKTNEYNFKLKIKEFEQQLRDENHAIEILNGKIFRQNEKITALEKDIESLKNSKVCLTCGQELSEDHQHNINEKIKNKIGERNECELEIKNIQNTIAISHESNIKLIEADIIKINEEIKKSSLEMTEILDQIGILTNEKNDVEKRNELQNELKQIPIKIQNEELKIDVLEQKKINYKNSLKNIEENKRIEKGLDAAKDRLKELETQENDENENVIVLKSSMADNQKQIKENENLIAEFKTQEYQDMLMNLYKKCVHRDGIPKQLLQNYIIPKINITLKRILLRSPFKVYLDNEDLMPKLVYDDRPTAIIDCIGSSGKERTFSSIVLKFSLNQINVKSKPTIFILDEIMGKFQEDSIEEFVEILHQIKESVSKLLIVEHRANIEPDHIINVQLDDNGISSLTLN